MWPAGEGKKKGWMSPGPSEAATGGWNAGLRGRDWIVAAGGPSMVQMPPHHEAHLLGSVLEEGTKITQLVGGRCLTGSSYAAPCILSDRLGEIPVPLHITLG